MSNGLHSPSATLESEPGAQELIVVPVELPIEWDAVKEFRDTGVLLSIKPPKGSRKKESLNIRLDPPVRKSDVSLLNYICEALIRRNSKLIPFVWNNRSVRKLARHYHVHCTSSPKTLKNAASFIHSFCEFLERDADEVVSSLSSPEAVKKLKEELNEWQAELKALDLAPNTIKVAVGCIKAWLQINDIEVGRVATPKGYIKFSDRAPTPEELQRMLDVADLHGKVIISILATSGLRIGTLAKLKYRHVKEDLEAGRVPVCIRVDAEITKGKYAGYYTFINKEATEYLKQYLKARKEGTLRKSVPPENITDDSPLIIDMKSSEPKHVQVRTISANIRRIMRRAGLIGRGKKRYEIRPHSLRKYFKTQMTAKGVPGDYIEFMMGHVISTYHDVKSLGVEYLREVYRRAGISIRPQTKASKVEMLKEIVRSLGLDPEKVLVEEALMEPNRTLVDEGAELDVLQRAVQEWVRKTIMGDSVTMRRG